MQIFFVVFLLGASLPPLDVSALSVVRRPRTRLPSPLTSETVKHLFRKVNYKARAQNIRLARIEAEVNNIIHDQKSIVKEMNAMNKNMKQLYHEPENAKDVASHNKLEGNGRRSDSEEPVDEHE